MKEVKDMTDLEVEMAIKELNRSEAVRLAQKEQRLKAGRRKALYQLQWLERRGKQLMESGINADNIAEALFGDAEA